MKQNCHLIWLNEIKKEDESFVGEKAASLAELRSLKINIPPGFVITSHAYSLFTEFNQLKRKIKNILSLLNPKHPVSLQTTSEEIKDLFQKSSFPYELAQEVIDAYFELGHPFKDTPIALRTSIIEHPLLQQTTVLNIKGEANLIESLKICWSSLFAPKNILASFDKKQNLLEKKVTVLVQKMIQSKTSGVIYTHDIVRNKKNVMMIKAIYGLGLLGAKGETKPDQYFVDKQNFKIYTKEIHPQIIELKLRGNHNKKVKVSCLKQKKQKLNDQQVVDLVKIGKKIQDYYYFPQEIEWGIEKEKIFIFQSKSIK